MTTIIKATPLLDQFETPSYKKTKKTRISKKTDRQQAAKDIRAILQERCYFVDSEDAVKASLYREVIDFIDEKIQESPKQNQVTKTVDRKQETVDNTDEDLDEIFYNEYESPDIVNAFVNVAKNMPISDEQTESIYSDEELENF